LKVLAYEFYFDDPRKGIQFAGIFPERRKDPNRVNRDSVKKLGQWLTGKGLDSKKLHFIKVAFDSNTGRIIRLNSPL
jgi:hypothetical protein